MYIYKIFVLNCELSCITRSPLLVKILKWAFSFLLLFKNFAWHINLRYRFVLDVSIFLSKQYVVHFYYILMKIKIYLDADVCQSYEMNNKLIIKILPDFTFKLYITVDYKIVRNVVCIALL